EVPAVVGLLRPLWQYGPGPVAAVGQPKWVGTGSNPRHDAPVCLPFAFENAQIDRRQWRRQPRAGLPAADQARLLVESADVAVLTLVPALPRLLRRRGRRRDRCGHDDAPSVGSIVTGGVA